MQKDFAQATDKFEALAAKATQRAHFYLLVKDPSEEREAEFLSLMQDYAKNLIARHSSLQGYVLAHDATLDNKQYDAVRALDDSRGAFTLKQAVQFAEIFTVYLPGQIGEKPVSAPVMPLRGTLG